MKTLLLLRHAKSSWKDEGLADHDRPLNKRGKKAAPLMGQLLRREGLLPDLVLSSTAVRARRTAEEALAAAAYEGPLELLDELYLASPGTLLDVAARVPAESVGRLLLVAHNPGMEDLVGILSGRTGPFPTAALAAFDIEIESWRDLALGVVARPRGLWLPREEKK